MPGTEVVEVVAPVDRAQVIRLFQAGYEESSHHLMMAAWLDLRDRWLRRYASPKTRDAYQQAFNRWYEFIGKPLWLVGSTDVEAWIEDMQAAKLSHATINLQLAACSSFYSFVIKSVRMGADGVERTLFFDGAGRTRSNPFRTGNVERMERKTIRNTKPLSRDQLKAMRDSCNPETRTGARDLALFECYLRSGRRLAEIVRLRWGDIKPSTERKGQYVFDWQGKGGKGGKRPTGAGQKGDGGAGGDALHEPSGLGRVGYYRASTGRIIGDARPTGGEQNGDGANWFSTGSPEYPGVQMQQSFGPRTGWTIGGGSGGGGTPEGTNTLWYSGSGLGYGPFQTAGTQMHGTNSGSCGGAGACSPYGFGGYGGGKTQATMAGETPTTSSSSSQYPNFGCGGGGGASDGSGSYAGGNGTKGYILLEW